MKKADIAVVGLAVMGANLARNMESQGFTVTVFNRSPEKLDSFISQYGNTGNFIPAHSIKELCLSLKTPRKILLMVRAGKAVDEFIDLLLPELESGDIIIDGGNSFFADTERRVSTLADQKILFVGAGVSGGEEGALHGPSLMPGGNEAAWPHIREIFLKIAAKAPDETPCCDWIGSGGAGHFIKMVHNGIEYGDMQMIAEAYSYLRNILNLSPVKMKNVFTEWNQGVLDSYLIEITAAIMDRHDPESGKLLLDLILDSAGQKGTGKWTAEQALELSLPAVTITEAVFARAMSALKEERTEAAEILSIPSPAPSRYPDQKIACNALKNALYASKICSYAQGFQLFHKAAELYHWNLNYAQIARIWRGGCIIRAAFLNEIARAFEQENSLKNLMLAPFFRLALKEAQNDWRGIISDAIANALPMPAFTSALSYYDSYRSAVLPANLIQAQRDFFGAHTYERNDRPRGEFFHTDWTNGGGKTVSTTYNV